MEVPIRLPTVTMKSEGHWHSHGRVHGAKIPPNAIP